MSNCQNIEKIKVFSWLTLLRETRAEHIQKKNFLQSAKWLEVQRINKEMIHFKNRWLLADILSLSCEGEKLPS